MRDLTLFKSVIFQDDGLNKETQHPAIFNVFLTILASLYCDLCDMLRILERSEEQEGVQALFNLDQQFEVERGTGQDQSVNSVDLNEARDKIREALGTNSTEREKTFSDSYWSAKKTF